MQPELNHPSPSSFGSVGYSRYINATKKSVGLAKGFGFISINSKTEADVEMDIKYLHCPGQKGCGHVNAGGLNTVLLPFPSLLGSHRFALLGSPNNPLPTSKCPPCRSGGSVVLSSSSSRVIAERVGQHLGLPWPCILPGPVAPWPVDSLVSDEQRAHQHLAHFLELC